MTTPTTNQPGDPLRVLLADADPARGVDPDDTARTWARIVDGLDIDLAGYGIRGPIFQGGAGVRGIDNSGGYDDVTVLITHYHLGKEPDCARRLP